MQEEKENKPLTKEETEKYKRWVELMLDVECPFYQEFKTQEKGCNVLIGLGSHGLHYRYIDTREITQYDEVKGMMLPKELDKDQHISIKRAAICATAIRKLEKTPEQKGSDPTDTWMLDILYAPNGRIGVSFGDMKTAANFKNLLWNWAVGVIDFKSPRLYEEPPQYQGIDDSKF